MGDWTNVFLIVVFVFAGKTKLIVKKKVFVGKLKKKEFL